MRHDRHASFIVKFMFYYALSMYLILLPAMALHQQARQIDFIVTCPTEYSPLTLDNCYRITKE